LEVRARHVVEQQVVRQGEELPQALPQVLLDRGFVRQESIQRAVEAMVIDPLGRDPQQVLERGRPIPVLGDVQLARGLTQPGDHRHRGHLRPGDRFAAPRQEGGAEVVEPQGPPQRPPQPHLAERPRALDADPIEADRDRVLRGGGCLEELPLIGAPGDRLRQPPGAHAPLAVSSPRCAAVSCTTFRPRRTERTSRQYVCARPPFRTTVCRRYTAPHPARSLSPQTAKPTRAQKWHYTSKTRPYTAKSTCYQRPPP